MEGSKAPRLIVDPRPAPRRNPNPMAVAIGSPAHDSGVGKPNSAIFGNGAPAAVFVEVFVTNHIGRNIAGGLRVIFAAVAVTAPVVEVVVIVAETLNVGVELVNSGESASFARMHGICRAATGDLALAVANSDHGSVAGFVDVDLVVAGAKDGEGEVGRVNLKSFVVLEPAHAHVQGTFGDADLGRAVVEIQERKAGIAGKADRRGADVQLGARTVIGPKLVAGSDRAVDDGGDPIVGARGIEGNVAMGVAEPSDAAWRIVVIIGGGAVRRKEKHCQQGAGEARPPSPMVSPGGIFS